MAARVIPPIDEDAHAPIEHSTLSDLLFAARAQEAVFAEEESYKHSPYLTTLRP